MSCSECEGCQLSLCSPGYYGQKCDMLCSVNCRTLPCTSCLCEICNKTSGFCTNGCAPGWSGFNCDSTCPTNCAITGLVTSCDQSTGNCASGCQRGFYGEQCNITCSSYCTGSTCSQINGTCLNGCIDGYSGSICGETSTGGEHDGDEVAGAIGGAFVVVLWAAVVIVLICFIWKRRLKDIALFNRSTDLATRSNGSLESRRLHKDSCSSRGSGGEEEYFVTDEMYQSDYDGRRHSKRRGTRSMYRKRCMTMDDRIPVPCLCHHTGSHEYFIISDDVINHSEQCAAQNEYRVHFQNGRQDLPKRSSSDSDLTCTITSWRGDN